MTVHYLVARAFIAPIVAQYQALEGCVFIVGPAYDPTTPTDPRVCVRPGGVTGTAESYLSIGREADGFVHHGVIRRDSIGHMIEDAQRIVRAAADAAVPDAEFTESTEP